MEPTRRDPPPGATGQAGSSAGVTLRAGRLSASLDADGSVRALRVDGGPSLAGIGFLVRDDRWGTVAGETTGVYVAGGFARITGRHRAAGIDVASELLVELSASRLTCSVTGEALADSTVNRVGLVTLLPASWAGRPVVVDHTDGSSQRSRFPELVSPWQPFRDVAGFRTDVPQGRVRLRFAGDIFETEDQRNWSDASFKTYSRPLALPFPYRLAAGERFAQTVTVDLDAAPRVAVDTSRPATVVPGRALGLPRVGLCVGPDEDLAAYAAHLVGWSPAWLRTDVVVTDDGLAGGDRLAAVASLRMPVALAIHVAADGASRGSDELRRVVDALAAPPSAVYAFDARCEATTPEVARLVRAAVGGVPLLVGTDDNLAELNRHRVDLGEVGADGVVFAASPTVHDDDAAAICDTSRALAAMVATVRSFARGTLEVGPLTLRPRRNIHAPGSVDRLGRDAGSVDPRRHGPLAAAWLLSSLEALAAAGVERVTLGELSGPRGFVPTPGVRAPAFDVLRAVLRATTAREVVSSDDRVCGLDLDGALWLTNRSREPVEVEAPSGTLTVPAFGVAVTS